MKEQAINVPTPHNRAKLGEIAQVVLMPGDPLRAKWIAKKFLSKPKLVNDVRGMFAYTGMYKDKMFTVMAHGMGIPSIGIYSYELFKFHNVNTIIRVGSCGSYSENIDVGEVIVAKDAYSISNFAKEIGVKVNDNVLPCSKDTLQICKDVIEHSDLKVFVGRVVSADAFYSKDAWDTIAKKTQAIGVEMEAFGLYANAIKTKKHALTILTVSDSFVSGKQMTHKERQTSFKKMIYLALETAIKI